MAKVNNIAELQKSQEMTFKTVDRLLKYPLVSSAWTWVQHRYTVLKSGSKLVQWSVGRVEKVANVFVKPVLDYFEAPIQLLDELAATWLDSMEPSVAGLHSSASKLVAIYLESWPKWSFIPSFFSSKIGQTNILNNKQQDKQLVNDKEQNNNSIEKE